MADKNKKEEKPEFTLLHAVFRLSAETYCATANAPKPMRLTICRKLHDLTDYIVDLTDAGNELDLFDYYKERQNAFATVEECMKKYKRRLEVATKCRCLSLGDQKVLFQRVGEIDNKLQRLKSSDSRRYEAYIKTGVRK